MICQVCPIFGAFLSQLKMKNVPGVIFTRAFFVICDISLGQYTSSRDIYPAAIC